MSGQVTKRGPGPPASSIGSDYLPSKDDIDKAREMARAVSPRLAAMFDAEPWEVKRPQKAEIDKWPDKS